MFKESSWFERVVIGLVTILILGVCVFFAGREMKIWGPQKPGAELPATAAPIPQGPPETVVAKQVDTRENVVNRRYSGVLETPMSVNLIAQVSGEIKQVNFADGAPVSQGDVLYVLDQVKYAAEVQNAEANVAASKAKLDYAQHSYNRTNTLFEKQASSQDSMENSLSSMDAARASLMAAEATLTIKQDDLAKTQICAPISGVAGVTNYTQGNYVTTNSGTLVTIVQTDPLRVKFAMSNRDFLEMFGSLPALMKEGEIKLRLANDKIYEEAGKVEFIGNEANRRTDTIEIYALFPNPRHELIVGSVVTVLLSRHAGSELSAVLPSAVMHDSQGAYVYKLDAQNLVTRQAVELGTATADRQLLLSGLNPGDTVIVDGTHKVRPGMTVAPEFKE